MLSIGLLLPVAALADTLVDNVNGIAVGARGDIVRFDALLIGDDGRIAQVLSAGDRRPARVDYRVDGRGRIVLPGFVDSHVRLNDLGFSRLILDLSDAGSTAEVQAKVAAYAAAHPDRPWILGAGWDLADWAEPPSAANLDGLAGDRPVWLVSADGHSGWANSAALKAAGARGATVVSGSAKAAVEKAVPPPRPEDRDLAFLKAQELLLANGVTAVTAMGATIEDWQAWRRAGDTGALRLRIIAYADGVEAMALIGGPGPTPWLYDDRLRLNGVVLRVDGTLALRTAALKKPYSDDAKNSGAAALGETQLKNLMSRAAMDGFQVAVTATGDAAFAQALDAIEAMSETYKGDRRWRIEHAAVIDPADTARLASLPVVISLQPRQQPEERALAEARLGEARLGGVFSWKTLADAGATLAFGSGAPARSLAPFDDIATAVTRTGTDNQPFGGWQSQQRLTREAALAAYTAGAARAGLADDRFGQIAVGQHADFVLVDRDPLLATPGELRATRVLQTWIGGQLVYDAAQRGER